MPYEKYIKKDGKIYGPYLYHSKRVDGKVISEYHGPNEEQTKLGKFFLMFGIVALLAVTVYFMGFSENKVTGHAVLDLDASYVEGKTLDGKITLTLHEGELIPADSKVVFNNNGKTLEYNIKDLTSQETVNGDFYVQNKGTLGSGEGFGLIGEKEVNPKVDFLLNVLTETNSNSDAEVSPSVSTEETIQPQVQETPSTSEQTSESGTLQETPQDEIPAEDSGSPIDAVVGFFLALTPTGHVVAGVENQIGGSVSKDNPFEYDLSDGQSVELVPRSVKSNGEQLDDGAINLEISGNKLVVTTDYSQTEKGFGGDFLGDGTKNIVLDLSSTGIVLEQGTLEVSVIGSGTTLLSLETDVSGEEVKAQIQEEPESKTKENLKQEPVENETPINIADNILVADSLTSEERNILLNEFGNASVNITSAVSKNGFVVVRMELGGFWIENSYSSGESETEIKRLVDLDKEKWLKDIARSLSTKDEQEQQISTLTGSSGI